MKKNAVLLGLTLGLIHIGAQAALPPTYQRLVELKAILDDTSVLKNFPEGSLVDRVEYVKPDHYEVAAGQCTLTVTLKDKSLPIGMVGARQFDLEVGSAKCSSPSSTR